MDRKRERLCWIGVAVVAVMCGIGIGNIGNRSESSAENGRNGRTEPLVKNGKNGGRRDSGLACRILRVPVFISRVVSAPTSS